jgi:hypothetical protein
MALPRSFSCTTYKRQQGIATILIVVLVGLGLTATSLGIVNSVRSTQQKQIAAHAITHSQAGAWIGVEVFRRYLAGLTTDQLLAIALNQSIDFTLPGTTNIVNSLVTERTAPSGSETAYKLKTRLTYTDIAAKSSAALEVIYEFSPPANNAGVTIDGELNFHRTTTLGGGITVYDAGGSNQGKFNVDGNLDLSSIGLSGVVNLNSTGNITLGSAVPALEVFANGSVLLNGSANVNVVSGIAGVELTGGSRATTIKSNGLVKLYSSTPTTSVTTTGNVEAAGSGTHASILAKGNLALSASSTITSASIGGTSSLNVGSWPRVVGLDSVGNITCTNNSWNNFVSIKTKGTATGCNAGVQTGQSAIVAPTVATLVPFVMVKPRIDVWNLKSSANYVFEPAGTKIKVTVNNINSITNGVYYLGVHTYNGTVLQDALCQSVNAAGVCEESSASTRTICNGQSLANTCISYNSSLNQFTLNSKNLAPGVMWFKGKLLLNNGNYFNTFLATNGIQLGGATTVTSLNYGGYTNTCNAVYQGAVSLFTGLYPKNFCNTTTSTLIANALGNPALIAGGYDPSQGGTTYSGGDINLGGNGHIYGSILSGDTLSTAGGETYVHGYISAAALAMETDSNVLGGSTTIDLRNLPASYTPNQIPDMSTPPPADPDVARVLWSRFL